MHDFHQKPPWAVFCYERLGAEGLGSGIPMEPLVSIHQFKISNGDKGKEISSMFALERGMDKGVQSHPRVHFQRTDMRFRSELRKNWGRGQEACIMKQSWSRFGLVAWVLVVQVDQKIVYLLGFS